MENLIDNTRLSSPRRQVEDQALQQKSALAVSLMADNRQEAQQQQQQQDLFNNGIKAQRAMQRQAIFSKNIGEGTLQCAVNNQIVPNVLNVAGESHGAFPEGLDKDLMSRTGLNPEAYWTEMDFAAHDPVVNMAPVEEQDAQEEHPPLADPIFIGMLHDVEIAKEMMIYVENTMRRIVGIKKAQQANPGDKWKMFDWNERIADELKDLEFYLETYELTLVYSIPDSLDSYLAITNPQRAVDQKTEGTITSANDLKELVASIDEIDRLRELAPIPYNEDIREGEIEGIIDLLKGMTSFASDIAVDMSQELGLGDSPIPGKSGSKEDDISAYRSYYMHQAANERMNTPGLWKIGEAHVQDILRNKDNLSPINYNLIPKNEYLKLLQRFPLLKNI